MELNMKDLLKKSAALILALGLNAPSFAAPMAAPAMPDFAKALTPPSQFGYIESSFKGSTENPVILIQDLHANYGVQRNIEGLLNHLQPKVAQNGRSMVLGIEAAWGDLDLSPIREQDKKVREVAGDILLKNAEITGMEQFVAMSEAPVKFVGIDNPEDYMLHRELLRKSLFARLELARKVEMLRTAVTVSKSDAPASLKKLWRMEDEFHAGKTDLVQLAKQLNVPAFNSYGEAEAALAQKKLAVAGEVRGDDALFAKNIVQADQNLDLLSRLLRQQLTFEEVQFATSQVPSMLVAIQALIPGENLEPWREAIRAAIDYYAVALMRDAPMAQNTLALASQHADTSVVIVTGGFHTAGIAETLREKNVSYVVIAPVVQAHTAFDETLYIKRMMGNHMSAPEISKATKAAKSGHALGLAGFARGFIKGAPNTSPSIIKNDHGQADYTEMRRIIAGVFSSVAAALKKPLRGMLAERAAEAKPLESIQSSVDATALGKQLEQAVPALDVGKTKGFLPSLWQKLVNFGRNRRSLPLADIVESQGGTSLTGSATGAGAQARLPDSVTLASTDSSLKNLSAISNPDVGRKVHAGVAARVSNLWTSISNRVPVLVAKRQADEAKKNRSRLMRALVAIQA
jgi:hypothetical protein